MKRSKPFYIFGTLIISIVFLCGALFGIFGFKKDKDDRDENFWKSFLDSFDWNTFPWATFPFEDFQDFPWENLPWDEIPWDNVPDNFPWDKVPDDVIPWENLPWESLPDDFDWNRAPWQDMPDDFDWNNVPWQDMPGDFDWNNVPWESLPDDFDWNNVPWPDMPGDFDWGNVPWDKLPDDFDWGNVPWDKLPEDFDWNNVPWQNMPGDFWENFPWQDLPENFPWEALPWLAIPPEVIPDGALPDGFYPPEWNCEHEFTDEWVTVKEATCTEDGLRQNTCTKCHKLIKEKINSPGKHTFGRNGICEACGIHRLIFKSADATKTYDGTPVKAERVEYMQSGSGGLLDGHRLNYADGSFDGVKFETGKPYVGSSPNFFSFTQPVVVDGNGNDVTDRYHIVIEYGKLEITTKRVTLKTKDKSKPFDGTPLTGDMDDVIAEGLVKGDRLEVTFGEGLTSVGRKENSIVSYRIVNAEGVDVTGCYAVETEFGWLRVEPAR